MHDGAIWQTFPQAPQLFLSICVLAQTFWIGHAVSPPEHVNEHDPLHTGVPLAGAVQTLHVPPHLLTSSSAAHSAPHAWKFALHEKSQVLFPHEGMPLRGVGQRSPQRPQLLGFVAVSTHWSPHLVWPGAQVATQLGVVPTAPEQSGALEGHTVPHPPQLAGPSGTQAPPHGI
jgi:hypothetical protein